MNFSAFLDSDFLLNKFLSNLRETVLFNSYVFIFLSSQKILKFWLNFI